jgi:glycosyltransferase involved in cell wall biosynthesis
MIGSLAWKRMVDHNWSNGTFRNKVDHYICPTRLVGERHVEMGLPSDKITVIPNACEDPLAVHGSISFQSRGSITYVGRLVREKGVEVLLQAWNKLVETTTGLPELRIIGSGPDDDRLKQTYGTLPGVHFHGQLPREEVMRHMLDSQMLVFPSQSPEIFGLGIIEAMAAGCPVMVSNLGGPAELFDDGVEGLLFEPGNAAELSQGMASLLADPSRMEAMGSAARALYEDKYSTSQHARNLVRLFGNVLQAS